MNSRFWSNHYASTIAWWLVLFFFIRDWNHRSRDFLTSTNFNDIALGAELIALLLLTFIRGINYGKFKQRQKNMKE